MEPKIIKYSKKMKRVSLQRYLVSKMINEHDKIRERDLLCLFDNQLWLERKCLSDTDFSEKFGKSLEDLSIILKKANFSQGVSIQTLKRMSLELKENLSGFYVNLRNYSSFKRRFDGHYHLHTLGSSKESNKHIPPKRFIGIGYRDKGTARDLALDGSPSWQEVASSGGQTAMYKEIIRNAKTFKDIERAFIEVFDLVPDGQGWFKNSSDTPKEAPRSDPSKED